MNKILNIARGVSFARTGILCLLLTAYCVLASAQNFPVQVIPQALPPAPIYISNYADASTVTSPLRVQIILNDFEIANREIRLKTYFTGSGLSFQSNDIVVGASPLFLEGGIPLVLTNVELAPYFEFNNITGINANQYGNAIPEGAYQFCVEVYDVLTGSRLSNKSCAISVVFQNEPPFLVLPRNKENVAEVNPQYIVFQWTPRSINVSNVEYELSLVEIWDNQVDPQQAFLSSPPVFQTTTSATTYVYGPSDPLLLSGKNYAWRVQAKAKQGTEEIGLFKNEGYSEIYSFSYAGSCELPLAINHEVKGSTNANIFWDDFSTDIPEYTVRYRKVSPRGGGLEGAEWFLSKTTANRLTLWDLKAGTTYEYQVSKKCSVTESDWSLSKQFTTFIADDGASVYECGIAPDFNITNQDPLQTIGDKFTAGDFPIKVLEASGSNGRFTGKGYVTIPYLNSIRVGVEFTNVLLNTDNQLVEGSVITMYDPSLKNILDIDDAVDTVTDAVDVVGEFFEGDNDLDEIKVDWEITKGDITIEDGKVVITNPYNGVATSEPLGDDMAITDSAGNTYYVDEEGKVTEGGQIDQGNVVNSDNVEGVSNNGQVQELTAKGIKVTFTDKGTYGMDILPESANAKLKSEYTIIKDADGKDYPLTHHAVPNKGSAQIKAEITLQNDTYVASDVVFKNKRGEIIPHTLEGNTATLTVQGRFTFENETVYAVVPDKEDSTKQLTAGAFTLWHLTERNINVAIVSVGASVGDVQNTVTDIFKNSIATIHFKETIPLDPKAVQDLLGSNGMDVGDSPFTSAYNQEQKALRALAKAKGANDSDTYYVIVLGDTFKNTESIAGFMPLQRQFGFVFQKYVGKGEEAKGNLARTLAHELGHGVFALQHPFAEYGTAEKATDWLMDYSNGDHLPHTHWAQVHDPDLKFYVFQKEEEGEGTFPDPIMVERYIERYRCAYKSGEPFKYDSTEPSNVWAKNITIGGVKYDKIEIDILKNNSPFIPKEYSDDIYKGSQNNPGINTSWTTKDIINFKNYFRIHFPKDEIGPIVSYLYPTDDQWQIYVDSSLDKVSSLGAEDDKELLKILSPCILKSLPVVKRIDLINRLADGATTETKEEIILDLVEHVNANEIDPFLILLAGTKYRGKTGRSLLYALINEEINDSYILGDDNLQKLVQVLTRLTNKSNVFNDKYKSLSAEEISYRMINYDYKSIWERLNTYTQWHRYPYFIKTDVSMNQVNSKITVKSTLMDGGFSEYELLSEKSFDAFEPIIFINKSNLSMLDIYDSETYQIVPAVVARYADKKAWNKSTSDIINATIDVVSLATGYGEIKVAITGIRKALIITDMVNAGVNLTMNVSGAGENLSENAQKVLTTFNVLTGAIGAVETMAGKNIDQIFKSVNKSNTLPQIHTAQTFINNIINANQDLSKLSSGEIESLKWMANRLKIDTKLNDLTEFEKSIDEAIDILNNLTEGIDDLPSLIKKWDNLTVTEAKSLYSKLSKTDALGSKTVVSQSEILAEINSSSNLVNPYNFAYSIDDIVLSQEALFVRIHNSWNPNRPWLVTIEDFQKFTSQDDMIKKLALPPILDNSGNVVKPTQISIVKVPAGTKVRKSVARPQDWPGQGHQPGGSVQFEIRDNPAIPQSWFKPMGNVSDYLN